MMAIQTAWLQKTREPRCATRSALRTDRRGRDHRVEAAACSPAKNSRAAASYKRIRDRCCALREWSSVAATAPPKHLPQVEVHSSEFAFQFAPGREHLVGWIWTSLAEEGLRGEGSVWQDAGFRRQVSRFQRCDGGGFSVTPEPEG